MIIPDVNLLLYANVDSYPQHTRARKWLEAALAGDVGLPAPSIFGFVRIATNPRIFRPAMSVDDALGRVDSWLAQPGVHFLAPGPRHLDVAFRLLRDLGAGANMTTDVQLAAYAIENQAELCSNDGDFGRFAGLRWRNPLS